MIPPITSPFFACSTKGAENASAPMIDVALIIEPTASHISGYLDVLAIRDGVSSVAVAVAVEPADSDETAVTAALKNAKEKLGKRFFGENGFRDAERHSPFILQFGPSFTIFILSPWPFL